jgi:hypothetical protein
MAPKKILLKNNSFNCEGVALRMNQSFAFKFLWEYFQPKLINSYSNFQWFFLFSIMLPGQSCPHRIFFGVATILGQQKGT